MIENKNIRIIKEDMVLGNGCDESEVKFGYGYDDFQYPLTVSFCSEGRYEVIIKGKHAVAKRVN